MMSHGAHAGVRNSSARIYVVSHRNSNLAKNQSSKRTRKDFGFELILGSQIIDFAIQLSVRRCAVLSQRTETAFVKPF